MLVMWKSSYMHTRQAIEDSGKGQRWEFDKKVLFSDSDYMALVCKDLYDVATVIKQKNRLNSFIKVRNTVDNQSIQ